MNRWTNWTYLVSSPKLLAALLEICNLASTVATSPAAIYSKTNCQCMHLLMYRHLSKSIDTLDLLWLFQWMGDYISMSVNLICSGVDPWPWWMLLYLLGRRLDQLPRLCVQLSSGNSLCAIHYTLFKHCVQNLPPLRLASCKTLWAQPFIWGTALGPFFSLPLK